MRILFQGDSITDWNRRRDDPAALGMGYVRMAAATLGFDEIESMSLSSMSGWMPFGRFNL